MPAVKLRASRADLVAAMSAIRNWLDWNHHPEVRFETSTEAGEIILRLQFRSEHIALAFRAEFGGALAEAA